MANTWPIYNAQYKPTSLLQPYVLQRYPTYYRCIIPPRAMYWLYNIGRTNFFYAYTYRVPENSFMNMAKYFYDCF